MDSVKVLQFEIHCKTRGKYPDFLNMRYCKAFLLTSIGAKLIWKSGVILYEIP